jgi:hypothetical protein
VLPTPHDELQKEVALKLKIDHTLSSKRPRPHHRTKYFVLKPNERTIECFQHVSIVQWIITMQVLAVNRKSLPQVPHALFLRLLLTARIPANRCSFLKPQPRAATAHERLDIYCCASGVSFEKFFSLTVENSVTESFQPWFSISLLVCPCSSYLWTPNPWGNSKTFPWQDLHNVTHPSVSKHPHSHFVHRQNTSGDRIDKFKCSFVFGKHTTRYSRFIIS